MVDGHDREQPNEQVKALFGTAFSQVEHFGRILAEEGETRGVIGPHEIQRLWSRHLENSAALLPFIPTRRGITVLDVGSGAGLPGIVIACCRPDAELYLLEPMERRLQWLADCVAELGLENVTLLRGRAQDLPKKEKFDYVTARAVANMRKLVLMCAKQVRGGGKLLALKGQKASDEVRDARTVIRDTGLIDVRIHEVVSLMDGSVTRVVEATKKR